MFFNKRKGFTLVELLIVIAVIGILFVVLVSRVDFATDKARTTGAQNDIKAIQTALYQVALEDYGFSNDIDTLAKRINENIDSELAVFVQDGIIKSKAEDPWGTQYQLMLTHPANTKGQSIILSAGPDTTFSTKDDIQSILTCNITAKGLDIVIENDKQAVSPEEPGNGGHTHTFNIQQPTSSFIAVQGSCISPTTYYYSCSCGAMGSSTFTGNTVPNNHVATTTSTYQQHTNLQHIVTTICSGCSVLLSTTTEAHSINNNICINCGYNEHVHEYNQQITTLNNLKTEATCSSEAVYYYTCTCGQKGTTTFTHGSKLIHQYNENITKYPSCTTKGIRTYTCMYCSHSCTEDIDPYSHSYVQRIETKKYEKEPATCMTGATYYFVCVCGDIGTNTFTSNTVNTNNHIGETETKYEYYNANQHYVQQICNACNNIIIQNLTNHIKVNNSCTLCQTHTHVYDQQTPNADTERTKATCSAKATYFYSCACGQLGTQYYEYGNLSTEHIGNVTFGGKEDNHQYYTCCNQVLNTNHEYTTIVLTSPTCSVQGTTKYTCECGYTYTAQDIPTTEHSYIYSSPSESCLNTSATCITPATYFKTCICGAIGTETFRYGSTSDIHELEPEFAGTQTAHTKYACCGTIASPQHTYTSKQQKADNLTLYGNNLFTCECGYSFIERLRTINDYTWDEIRYLADANLSSIQYSNIYGIEVGQMKDETYLLLDLDGNSYDGFVFMYNSGLYLPIRPDSDDSRISYTKTPIAQDVNNLYNDLPTSLKNSIKPSLPVGISLS